MLRSFSIFVAIAAMLFSAGCVSSKRGDVYSRDDARRVQQVEYATVVEVRPVQIEGTKSGIGTVAGGVIGGIAGSGVGGGTGRGIATAVGAIVGGIVGSAAEEAGTRNQGMEITVRDEKGKVFAIVQAGEPAEFAVGQRVRILRGYGETRVTQ